MPSMNEATLPMCQEARLFPIMAPRDYDSKKSLPVSLPHQAFALTIEPLAGFFNPGLTT